MARSATRAKAADALPEWVAPQLTGWSMLRRKATRGCTKSSSTATVCMRASTGSVKLLTRTGLDWTHKSQAIAAALSTLGAREAFLDGELCGLGPDGITSFSMIQLASDTANTASLVFFLFDLVYLDGKDLRASPLIERKTRLAGLLSNVASPLHYAVILDLEWMAPTFTEPTYRHSSC
jgi:hypothetical protein